jgi:hypothetical protein
MCLDAIATLAAVILVGALSPAGSRRAARVGRVVAARDTSGMTLWLMVAAGFVAGVVAAHAVTVRRDSPSHVVGEVSVAGRGLFFSRTPDGIWWRVRLRGRDCTTTYPADWGDAPPDAGVREPRRPPGRGPLNAARALERPDR